MRWQSAVPAALIVEMSPDLADELLALNDPQRTASASMALVGMYRDVMSRGRWSYTGDTFKVNASGNLIDGTHRLLAIIRSGWRGPALIAIGVPDISAWEMDPPGMWLKAQ